MENQHRPVKLDDYDLTARLYALEDAAKVPDERIAKCTECAKLWEWVTRFDLEVTELQTNARHLKSNTENHLLAHDRRIQGLSERTRVLEEGGSTYDSLSTQQYVGMLDAATDEVVIAEMNRYVEARRRASEDGLRAPETGRFSEDSKVSALLTEHISRVR